MVNGTLVVDAVVHAVNASLDNIAEPIRPMAEPLLDAVYGLHVMLAPEGSRLERDELLPDELKARVQDDDWARERSQRQREPWSSVRELARG